MSKYPIMVRIYIITQICMTVNCYFCDPNCDNCSVTCLSCKPGYYPSGTSCNSCPQNCTTCNSVDQCLSCSTGNYLLQELCYPCPNNCSSCENQNTCTKSVTLVNDVSKSRDILITNSPINETIQLNSSSTANSPMRNDTSLRYNSTVKYLLKHAFQFKSSRILNSLVNDADKLKYNSNTNLENSNTSQLIKTSDSQINKITNSSHSASSSDDGSFLSSNFQIIKETIITLGAFFTLIGILFSCLKCCRRKEQNQSHNNVQRLGNPQEIRSTQMSIQTENTGNWQRIPQIRNGGNSICGICQDTQWELNVQTNCKTKDCKNAFHYKCLDQWRKRKGDLECPNCKKLLEGVKLMCKRCHQRSKLIDWRDFNKISEFSEQKQKCDTCTVYIQDIESFQLQY